MKSYIIDVDGAQDIPGIVYRSLDLPVVPDPTYVFLNHGSIPSVIRGNGQPFSSLPGKLTENGYQRDDGILEVRRPDGGMTWFHPRTVCMMKSSLVNGQQGSSSLQRDWGHEIIAMLERLGYAKPGSLLYGGPNDPDIYVNNHGIKGPQAVGLSAKVSRNNNGDVVCVNRAAWYQSDPTDEITDLLVSDGIDPELFSSAIFPLEGLSSERVIDETPSLTLEGKIESSQFVLGYEQQARNLQARPTSMHRANLGSCILGPVYPYPVD